MQSILKATQIGGSALFTGHGNLADPQPKVRMVSATPAAAWGPANIDIDLQADTAFDTIALLHHSGGVNGWWRCYGRTAAAGPFGADESGATIVFASTSWRLNQSAPASSSHAVWASTVRTFRYIRVQVYSPDAGSPNWSAGVLMLGLRLQPGEGSGLPSGFDWGAGRRVSDMSAVTVLSGGETAVWKKAKVPEVRGSFSHLTDAETQRLWSLLTSAGESEPVLLVEAPDTLGDLGGHERVHYGSFAAIDFFERRQASKSRFDVRLRHWL